jgi:hypothetical protein
MKNLPPASQIPFFTYWSACPSVPPNDSRFSAPKSGDNLSVVLCTGHQRNILARASLNIAPDGAEKSLPRNRGWPRFRPRSEVGIEKRRPEGIRRPGLNAASQSQSGDKGQRPFQVCLPRGWLSLDSSYRPQGFGGSWPVMRVAVVRTGARSYSFLQQGYIASPNPRDVSLRWSSIIGLGRPDRGAVSAQGALAVGSTPFACPLSMHYF